MKVLRQQYDTFMLYKPFWDVVNQALMDQFNVCFEFRN